MFGLLLLPVVGCTPADERRLHFGEGEYSIDDRRVDLDGWTRAGFSGADVLDRTRQAKGGDLIWTDGTQTRFYLDYAYAAGTVTDVILVADDESPLEACGFVDPGHGANTPTVRMQADIALSTLDDSFTASFSGIIAAAEIDGAIQFWIDGSSVTGNDIEGAYVPPGCEADDLDAIDFWLTLGTTPERHDGLPVHGGLTERLDSSSVSESCRESFDASSVRRAAALVLHDAASDGERSR